MSVVSSALFFLTAAAASTNAASEPAVTGRSDPQYEDCVQRIYKNVPEGRAFATRWADDGGGPPALHCLAVAELAAGFPRSSAVILEDLSGRPDAGDDMVRARILSQAALAWLEAGSPEDAERALGAAFASAPEAGELQLTAAKVHAARGKHQATIDAVGAAETAGFTSAEGYVLRGRARYALTDYRSAADDVVAALTIEPTNLDALVLRGDLFEKGVDIASEFRPKP